MTEKERDDTSLLDVLTRLQASAQPSEDHQWAVVPADMWREFVDAHAEALHASPSAISASGLNENDEPLRELCFDYRNAYTPHAENYFQRIVRWVNQQGVRASLSHEGMPGNGTTPTTPRGSAETSGKAGTEARHASPPSTGLTDTPRMMAAWAEYTKSLGQPSKILMDAGCHIERDLRVEEHRHFTAHERAEKAERELTSAKRDADHFFQLSGKYLEQLSSTAPTDLLRRISVALDDWINTYAADMCDEKRVKEAHQRIMDEGGTLHYIATLQQDVKKAIAALSAIVKPQGEKS